MMGIGRSSIGMLSGAWPPVDTLSVTILGTTLLSRRYRDGSGAGRFGRVNAPSPRTGATCFVHHTALRRWSHGFDALRVGHDVVTWNIMARDWLGDAPEEMVGRVASGVRPGSVILFHDGLVDAADERYFERGATLEAVSLLLEQFADEFAFVTLPELLRRGRPHREHWVWEATLEHMNSLARQDGTLRQYATERRTGIKLPQLADIANSFGIRNRVTAPALASGQEI